MRFTIEIRGIRREMTPWLPGTALPQRAGVYQRSPPGGLYSRWDGRLWRGDAPTPDAAAHQQEPSVHQQASWRGLAEPPGPTEGPGR